MKPFSTFVAAGVQLYFVFSECPGSQTAFLTALTTDLIPGYTRRAEPSVVRAVDLDNDGDSDLVV